MTSVEKLSSKVYLVTGVAGFIGYHLAKRLLDEGCRVVGIDNLNNYYSVTLKQDRLNLLREKNNFIFYKADILDTSFISILFKKHKPDIVIHLAAQAGVRYSLTNPLTYMNSNIMGFYNILEVCKKFSVEHLYYASSSSVYGANEKTPFSEIDSTDRPTSLYAATKKTNELLAFTYNHLYGLNTTGLRFFTVYGPMGRPDMSYYDFLNKYFKNETITVYYKDGIEVYRDFTYIDDVIQSIYLLLGLQDKISGYRIYNIGNQKPVKLVYFIEILEKLLGEQLGKKIIFNKNFEPLNSCDVPITFADNKQFSEITGYLPNTSIEEGLRLFVDWYCKYYNILS